MSASVIRAHAARLPLPDACVDLIVTSPPYFGLRSYTDGGQHYPGQIGSEGTPAEWLDALLACTREWVRVLKPEGSLFVNLGDKYAGSGPGSATTNAPNFARHFKGGRTKNDGYRAADLRGHQPKSLLGLPWRYALACIDQLGLILRAEVIWSKPNGLPESVTDRVRRAHEQVFHFTRQPRYYAAVDEIRETYEPVQGGRNLNGAKWQAVGNGHSGMTGLRPPENPLGKLPGSVWSIPSQPLTVPEHVGVDHFAAFPMELPRRCILGWSPPGVCAACGQGRRPVVDVDYTKPIPGNDLNGRRRLNGDAAWSFHVRRESRATITGYACACPQPTAPTRPSVILDPFGGTGTTALVASVLGRHGITADLSADYCRLAAWRTTDPGERARALQVPKPPPIPDGQEALFPL